MRVAVVVVVLAVAFYAQASESTGTAVATVRATDVTADLDDGSIRIKLTASGQPPNQQIDTLRIWFDDSEIAVPSDAYSGSWNPNPAAIEIRKQAGVKRQLLPEDVVLPIISVTIVGYDGEAAFTLFLERGAVVFSYVRVLENLECRSFEPRYAETCETVGQEVRESKQDSP